MVTCEICGNEDFEVHGGFMYCAICQTQSQDYQEQEYDYGGHSLNKSQQLKSRTSSVKSKKQEIYDDGFWTTWEGFNYIIYGMKEEMKKCGANKEFEEMVFKLWAAYLKESKAAFLSRYEKKIPKLKFKFRDRDARILYNIETSERSRKKRVKSRSLSSRVSSTSTTTTLSKRSLIAKKRKLIESEYQEYLSSSIQNNSSLAEETLESLGRTSETELGETSDDNPSLLKGHMLSDKDYKIYKNLENSEDRKKLNTIKAIGDITFPAKNRLLSIIYLALLLTNSEIQLSDLLRFIRESHLSFAKVTHFFPRDMKLPKNDLSYMEVVSDNSMPAHLKQRIRTQRLARLLKIEQIPTPDLNALVDRYCEDLNLPKQIAEFGKKILKNHIPSTAVPNGSLPNYEACAVASVIFVIKLLFGLNGKTEIFLSHLALEVNSMSIKSSDQPLFVFKDWQEFIEYRKTVLINFHYPTQEQLNRSSFQNSRKFLDMLMKESKDEFRKERFIRYPKHYIEDKILEGIKQTLNVLSKPQNVISFEFHPSLTPQTSHSETIIKNLSEGKMNRDIQEDCKYIDSSLDFLEKTLKRSFRHCDVQFAFDPKGYVDMVEKNSAFLTQFGVGPESSADNSFQRGVNQDFLFDCQSNYWTLQYPAVESGLLSNFSQDILEKTPENFQWLIKECARMVEMHVRDVYDELLRLEKESSWRS